MLGILKGYPLLGWFKLEVGSYLMAVCPSSQQRDCLRLCAVQDSLFNDSADAGTREVPLYDGENALSSTRVFYTSS